MHSICRIKNKTSKTNIGVLFLLLLSCFFAFRVCNVLKNNKERGAYAFVQVINYEIPFVKTKAYCKEDFSENKISIKEVCLEAAGLKNINPFNIIKAEAACIDVKGYKGQAAESSSSSSFSYFELSEDSLVKNNKEIDLDNDDSLKKTLDQTKPEVLIYHTHTTESYSEDGPESENEQYNVVGVGDVIESELENNYGIATIHDKTNHSISYLKCYQRSNETVSRYLKKYGDFKLIIDVHRDSIDNKAAMTASYNGQNAAKIMFVNAKNSTRYQKNKEVAEFFKNRSNELFPGICKGIYTYNSGKNAFNQSLSDNSMLIEIGSDVNTIEEANSTAKCIARIIAEYINSKK